jgi:leucyl aminopeptidase
MIQGLVEGARKDAIELWPVAKAELSSWRAERTVQPQAWLDRTRFGAELGTFAVLPDVDGMPGPVVVGLGDAPNLWSWAAVAASLPAAVYAVASPLDSAGGNEVALGWTLGLYAYDRHKLGASARELPLLCVPECADREHVRRTAEATFLARDLINRPANDLGPSRLAQAASDLGSKHGASVTVTAGAHLLAKNFPAIHAVGAAALDPPCLIDLVWGDPAHPKLTLVGKGVCFDSGGLNIKGLESMRLMKKDMGGAAVVLGLASMVMDAALPVRLRVLIPAVENAISSSSYRPGDIVQTRKGLNIEVVNTDAEGRVILADALAEADSETPELLIECSTLTGAAKLALGNEVGSMFTPDDVLAADLQARSMRVHDPLWRMPLWPSYRKRIESHVADLSNMADGNYAGAITAALFLERFVENTRSWVHLDIFAWNDRAMPGRRIGGEATGMRALFDLVESRFGGCVR